jgi:glycosyltransferase involved in cell wall biosynthesis
MKTPIVSVIVPVYNVSQYLDRCLDSLVNQTLPDIEIICVNDASTDNSLEILKSWGQKDERIRIIDLPENRMLGAVRNVGMKAATGEYLGFLDSDDYVSCDFYQSLVDALKPGVDIVTTKYTMRFDGHSEQRLFQFKDTVDLNDQDSVKRSIAAYGCRIFASIFRRSYVIENQFQFVEGVFFEDNPIVQCMFLVANQIVVIDNQSSFWYYRINPSSIVHSYFSDRKISDRLPMQKLMLDNYKKYHLVDLYKEEFDYRFFITFYYNTIYLLLFRREDYRTDLIRQVYREYLEIAGGFPSNVYMENDGDYGVFKLIGKYPAVGRLYKKYKLHEGSPINRLLKKTKRLLFK